MLRPRLERLAIRSRLWGQRVEAAGPCYRSGLRRQGCVIQRTTSGKSVTFKRDRPKTGAELVFRFSFILSAVVGFVIAIMAIGCTTHSSTVVWEYYDQCAQENPSFLAMAECGRQKRLAECAPNNTCSPEGTMFMQYVDSLVVSVKKRELTEAEAMRRYKEYKSGGTPSHP